MNLKIKLDNSKYCNKCPLLGFWRGYYYCDLGYFKGMQPTKEGITRPQKCIKENGE